METAQKLPPVRFKLRWKILFILLSLISLILLVTNLLWFFSASYALKRKIFDAQEQISRGAAFRVQAYIQAKVNNLIARSQTNALLNKNLPSAQEELSFLLKEDKDIKDVSLIDTDGQELI